MTLTIQNEISMSVLTVDKKTKPQKREEETKKLEIDKRQTKDGPSLIVSLNHYNIIATIIPSSAPFFHPLATTKKIIQYQCHHFLGSCICLSSMCKLIWQPQYFNVLPFAITYSNTFRAKYIQNTYKCIRVFFAHK